MPFIPYIAVLALLIAPCMLAQTPRLQLQTAHTAAIRSMDVDPEGQVCLTASNDFSLRLWSLQQQSRGALLQVLHGHDGPVLGGVLNPNDSGQCISWSADETVRLWNIDNGVGIIIRINEVPTSLDVRNGSNLIAVSTKQGHVVFFDANTGAATDKVIELPFIAKSVRYNNKGDLLLIAGERSEISLYNVRTKLAEFDHRLERDAVVGALWTSDVSWTAVTESGEVLSGDTSGILTKQTLGVKVRSLARHFVNGNITVVTDAGETISFNLRTAVKRGLPKPTDAMRAYAAAVLANDEVISAIELPRGVHELTARSWSGATVPFPRKAESKIITAVSVIGSVEGVISGNNDGECWYWSTAKGGMPLLLTSKVLDKVEAITQSPDGRYCAIAGFGREKLGLLSLGFLDVRWIPLPSIQGIRDVRFVGNDRLLVVDDNQGDVLLITQQGEVLRKWALRTRTLLVQDTNTFVSVSDSNVVVQSLLSEAPTMRYQLRSPGYVVSASFDATKQHVVVEKAGGLSIVARLTQPANSSRTETPPTGIARHNASAASVMAGKRVVIGGVDGVLRTLESSSAADPLVTELGRLNGRPTSMDVSADGNILAVGMQDGTTALVNAESGEHLITLKTSQDGWVAVRPNGQYDGVNSLFSSMAVVLGREVRQIEELPSALATKDLLHLTGKPGKNAVVTDSKLLRDIAKRPAKVKFDREKCVLAAADSCKLTYQLETYGSTVTSLVVFEGARMVHEIKSTKPLGLDVHTAEIGAHLKPDVNQFVIRAYMSDGRVATDTFSMSGSRGQPAAGRTLGLSVGIDNPDSHRSMGRSQDAKAVQRALQNMAGNADVQSLTNNEATTESILRSITHIARTASMTDNVVIYIAARYKREELLTGAQLHRIVLYDRTADQADPDGCTIENIIEALHTVNAAGVLLVMDLQSEQSEQTSVTGDYLQVFNRLSGGTERFAVMVNTTPSSGDAAAATDGALTQHFIKGIDGAAMDTSGNVTAFDLGNYIAKRMSMNGRAEIQDQQLVIKMAMNGSSMVLRRSGQ